MFDHWEQIEKELDRKYVLFFFDYDGTLAPIAPTPEKAVIPGQVKDLLGELSIEPNCALAVISGRSLEDIKKTIGLKNIIYAGNHGLEIEGPKIKFESPVSPGSQASIRQIYQSLSSALAKIEGALVEDKGLAVSVHYRLVGENEIKELAGIFSAVTEPYLTQKKIKITEGKKVYEIRPNLDWDKSKIVLWLLGRQQFFLEKGKVFPVYFGDDLADEEVFRALKNKGLTVFVGELKSTQAAYYVKDFQEVARFIKQFLQRG